jgi:hypothetical protein
MFRRLSLGVELREYHRTALPLFDRVSVLAAHTCWS